MHLKNKLKFPEWPLKQQKQEYIAPVTEYLDRYPFRDGRFVIFVIKFVLESGKFPEQI